MRLLQNYSNPESHMVNYVTQMVPTLRGGASTRTRSVRSGSCRLGGTGRPAIAGRFWGLGSIRVRVLQGCCRKDPMKRQRIERVLTVFISGHAMGRYACCTGHLRAAFSWG